MATRRRRLEVGILVAVVLMAIALVLVAIDKTRESARRKQSQMHLRHIGLALHSYHESYAVLPPGGVFDSAGTEYVGWPMLVLSRIDSNSFYSQINFKLPWDRQTNPEVFRWSLNGFFTIPGCQPVVDDSGFGLSHYAGNKHLLFENSSVSFSSVTDGVGQTMLAGEVFADFVPYARPGNWRDPAHGLSTIAQSFGRPTKDGAFFLMGDGRVVWLAKQIDPAVFHALGTPGGGETIPKTILADAASQE